MEKEYILCAAIWYDDGIKIGTETVIDVPQHFRGATFQNTNIDTGYVICGWRHGNIISIKATNSMYSPEIKDAIQGFMTSTGRFVDRWQAAYIGLQAEQELTEFGKERGYLKKRVSYDIKTDSFILEDGSIFDTEAFMQSKPSNRRLFEKQPFNMMYSEHFY